MSSSPTEHASVGTVDRCRRWASRSPRGRSRVAQAARRLGRGRRDDLRRDHRQGRRRDPVAGARAASRGSSSSRARRVAVGEPLAEIDPSAQARRGASRRTTDLGAGPAPDRPTAPQSRAEAGPARPAEPRARSSGSTRRSFAASPTSTGSTSVQVEGTGVGGRVRKTRPARLHRGGEHGRRPLHTESPYGRSRSPRAGAGRAPMADSAGAASRCRRCGRRSPGTWSEPRDAAHCTTIVEVDFSRSPRGGRELREAMAAARRAARPISPSSPGRRSQALQRAPGPQRLGRGRRDRPPRRRQPRHRGGARRRADRAGDPRAQRLSLEGTGRGDRRSRRTGARRRASSPTTCPAGRSRSPTRASSARCWRRRSSTSRRSRSSTSRRSSSGRSWSTDGGRRRDRDPADGLPLHVLGPPGARRRGGGAVPRLARRAAVERGSSCAIECAASRRRAAPRSLEHEELASARARSGPDVAIAVHSTALGPALGGCRMWHYAELGRRPRRRAAPGARR